MNRIARFIVYCAATLSALVAASALAGSYTACKNHYILESNCVPPSFAVPPVPEGVKHWTAIGPDGANVVALAVDPATPSTAFAGTLGAGVLKTTDSGVGWAAANRGLTTTNVLALAIDRVTSSTLYAGTDVGVFKSIDGGQNWAPANGGLDTSLPLVVDAIAIEPASPATAYALTHQGLFKTTDGGTSWVALAGLSRYLTDAIAIDPTSPSTVYLAVEDTIDDTKNGILKSTDGGATWTRIYTVPCGDRYFGCVDGWTVIFALAIDPQVPSRLYAAAGHGTMGISADGGATWSQVQTPDTFLSLVASSADLYATAVERSLYRSSDAGKTWTPVANAPVSVNAIALAASAPAAIYAGSGSGIYRSSDGAQTWTHLTLGVRAVGVYPFVIDPAASSTIYAATSAGVMKTTDGGAHWTESSEGLSSRLRVYQLAVDPVYLSVVYAIESTPFSGNTIVYRSTDGGAHWAPPSGFTLPPAAPTRTLAIAATPIPTLFMGGTFPGGLLKSTDGGASWTAANSGLNAVGPYVSVIAVDPSDDAPDTVYAATLPTDQPDTPAKIFKSIDGAAHWTQVPIDLPLRTEITSLIVDPVMTLTIYAAYADFGTPGQGGVFKSSDGGATWVAASQNLPPTVGVLSLTVDPNASSNVYAGTTAGVFASADGARSWTPINAGLPNVGVSRLAIDQYPRRVTGEQTPWLLRAATIAGLFEYQLSAASASTTIAVIEYYHDGLDHYFVTMNPDEIAKLDHGIITGWVRTGRRFNAYAGYLPAQRPFADS
jgi:photosystem II stability/assembly factor-like uncharacterized protein